MIDWIALGVSLIALGAAIYVDIRVRRYDRE